MAVRPLANRPMPLRPPQNRRLGSATPEAPGDQAQAPWAEWARPLAQQRRVEPRRGVGLPDAAVPACASAASWAAPSWVGASASAAAVAVVSLAAARVPAARLVPEPV